MARLREFDEEKALDAALQLFWEKGFEATSLSDLTSAMGIQRPSIYSAFGDKKALFEAALRKYTRSHAADVRARFQNHSSVREEFRTFLKIWWRQSTVSLQAGDAFASIRWWSFRRMTRSLKS